MFFALLVTPALAAAQPAAGASSAAAANVATASRAPEAPTLDGDVLGDPAWAQATPITGFTQEQPNEGQPVSERTEVRVIFTNDTLYIGAVMYDSDPSGIIVSDARRDAPMDDTDSFQMIVDTYRDRQNGFVFGTNPAGIEYDGQVTNEGQGGGGLGFGQMQSGGSGAGFNINWDGAWTVRTKTTEHGWSAEFAIPFRTLRYPSSDEPDLGHQLPAQHPPQERARVLGADSAAVQSLSLVAGRFDRPACRRRRCATSASRRTPWATRSRRASRRSTPRWTTTSAAT